MSDETKWEQWRIWAQPPEVGCLWKDALPAGAVAIETNLTVGACGEVVAAAPSRVRAEQIVQRFNAYEPMREALDAVQKCFVRHEDGCGCARCEALDKVATGLRAADEAEEG